jgi:signal peptidase I
VNVLPTSSKRRRRTVVDYALTVVIAVAIAFLVQAFLIKPYLIPSTSMATTLVPGQRVLVDRVVYHYRDIHRGDIIVFRRPVAPKDILIKRVVGLPGDTLSLVDGRLLVNGQALDEPYVNTIDGLPEPTVPGELAPGGHPIAEWSLEKPYTVPADHYFMMGDNRLDSSDSRYWGTVPYDHVIGCAVFSYWPLDRVGTL